ncbi:MAG: hypothetical protein ACOCZQ_03185 [Nanoarchaeota archaeon]
MSRKKRKLIYILGHSFSGSTLFDLIIGSDDSVVSTGESALLRNHIYGFDQSDRKNENKKFCLCGKKLNDCPLWGEILEKYSPQELFKQKSRKDAHKSILGFFNLYNPRVIEEEVLDDVINSARKFKPNVDKVVDSSKTLKRLIFLKKIDPFVIFLVKDGRSVVNRKRGYKRYFTWLYRNITAHLYLLINNHRYMIISYDKFAQNPAPYIKKLNKEIGLNIDPDTVVDKINSQQYHNIGGNGMRRRKIEGIKYNPKWRWEMPKWKQIIFNVLCYVPNKFWVYNKRRG